MQFQFVVLVSVPTALFFALSSSAQTLTTINPCPLLSTATPYAVTAQYQPVSTCVPFTTCFNNFSGLLSNCSTSYSYETWKYVSTTIPCAYDGSTVSSCVVTSTDDAVMLTTQTATLTRILPLNRHRAHSRGQQSDKHGYTTVYESIDRKAVAEYDHVGPSVIPGYSGSGLCSTCTDTDGNVEQEVEIIECRKRSNKEQTSCRNKRETWLFLGSQYLTATASAVCVSKVSVTAAGEYTYFFSQLAAASTITTAPHTVTVTLHNGQRSRQIRPARTVVLDEQPWYATITKKCNGPTIFDITTTITTTITRTLPIITVTSTTNPTSISTMTTGSSSLTTSNQGASVGPIIGTTSKSTMNDISTSFDSSASTLSTPTSSTSSTDPTSTTLTEYTSSSSTNSLTTSTVSFTTTTPTTSAVTTTPITTTATSSTTTTPACPSVGYLVTTNQNLTSLYNVSLRTGEMDMIKSPLGDGPVVNAIGYNKLNNTLYGVIDTIPPQAIRISPSGDIEYLLALPIQAAAYNVGDVDEKGTFWVGYQGFTWVEIELSTLTIRSSGSIEPGRSISDWAYVPGGGDNLYAIFGTSNGNAVLFAFNRADMSWSSVGLGYGKILPRNGQVGALYATSDGFLYGTENTFGQTYKFSLDGNTAEFIRNGTRSDRTDGAHCILAGI